MTPLDYIQITLSVAGLAYSVLIMIGTQWPAARNPSPPSPPPAS